MSDVTYIAFKYNIFSKSILINGLHNVYEGNNFIQTFKCCVKNINFYQIK